MVAIFLMVGVMVVTNRLFPPVIPEAPDPATVAEQQAPSGAAPVPGEISQTEVGPSVTAPGGSEVATVPLPAVAAQDVVVEGPLYRFVFTTEGARLTSAELLEFPSFAREGAVQLVPEGGLLPLGRRLVLGQDTLDLRRAAFEPSAASLQVSAGGGPRSISFRYTHPTGAATLDVEYTFHPDLYRIDVVGRVEGLEDALLLTDLGSGIPPNEGREQDDLTALAWVTKHDQEGIDSERLDGFDESIIAPGPFSWVAFKSKYFVTAMLAGPEGNENPALHFGGVIAGPHAQEAQAAVTVAQSLSATGDFERRLFFGPQEIARLTSLGADLEDVNPYGWRIFRPIVRPFTSIITTILVFLHDNLNIAYGYVLMLFGVMLRVLLWPLNQKAMRAQLRNMAVQPKIQEIQAKYKNNPEKLQQEMMKLYKEGFNPVAGCLPMLIPWPVLIALFFVFQNTIELRGVPFWWMPDLSAPDPLYILPVLMGASMFLVQWISLRTMPNPNPQMKIMMWVMPIFLMVLFFQFPSGLNLYYLTVNLATIPQTYWIAKERGKVRQKQEAQPAAAK